MHPPDTRPPLDAVGLLARYAAPLFLLVLVLLFALLEPRFLHPLNLMNILRQVSISGLVAVGMTFVILTAGIDLSVGSLVALCGLTAAYVAKGGLDDRFAVGAATDAGNPVVFAILAAVAVGMAAGALQGLAITRLRVPPFVVTLGGLTAFRGAALLLSGGGPISGFDMGYVWWGQGRVWGIPVPVIVFLTAVVLAQAVLSQSQFGRHVYAVGGNVRAAELNGIDVRRTTLSVYIIVGFFCGIASFLLSARLNSAEAVAGINLELDVIAAVVIGGTSLFGGVGSIFGTVVGVVLIGVLRNGLVLLGVSSFVQQILIGLILVLAVAIDQHAKSRTR
ncbi:MAG: ABC transporter permease [Pseudomonadota bacterium]